MNTMLRGLAALVIYVAPLAAIAQQQGATWDGLVEIRPKRVDTAFLQPGADFRPYRKVIVDPVVVAFRKDWLKSVNANVPLSERVTEDDAERMAIRTREIFADVFADVLKRAGLELAAAPGTDVLRVRPGVIDLYIAAPEASSGARSRTFTMEAGEATLFLEASDSTSGALLGRVIDKRTTRNSGRLRLTNELTNESDLRALFRRWAETCVKGFEELRALSPLPEDLAPGWTPDLKPSASD